MFDTSTYHGQLPMFAYAPFTGPTSPFGFTPYQTPFASPWAQGATGLGIGQIPIGQMPGGWGGQPPFGGQLPFCGQLPFGAQSPFGGQLPFAGQSPFGGQSLLPGQLAFGGQSPFPAQSPLGAFSGLAGQSLGLYGQAPSMASYPGQQPIACALPQGLASILQNPYATGQLGIGPQALGGLPAFPQQPYGFLGHPQHGGLLAQQLHGAMQPFGMQPFGVQPLGGWPGPYPPTAQLGLWRGIAPYQHAMTPQLAYAG